MTDEVFIKIAKALADPTRRGMIRELQRRGERTCSCMCERFPLSQPTVSHHLRTLEAAGLIRVRKDGAFHRLTLNEGALSAFAADLVSGREGAVAPRGRRARRSTGAASRNRKFHLRTLALASERKPRPSAVDNRRPACI